MGLLFKILGGLGLILYIAVIPNLHDTEPLRRDLPPLGLSILILGVGLVLDRVDRLLSVAKTGDSKPTG